MRYNTLTQLTVSLGLVVLSVAALANQRACEVGLILQDYEPNTFVIRHDENDVTNIDFKISQMIPLFHDGCLGDKSLLPSWWAVPYVSFTGQFGFYAFDGRDSRPVIGKRFNPKLFFRHWITADTEYLDFGYAHESNGQSIDTQAAYLQKVADLQVAGERTEFARDYLSRGWDYLDFNYKTKLSYAGLLKNNFVYVNLKYFLAHGIFQGEPEEFYSWETTDGKHRKEVDGVSLLLKTSSITKVKKEGSKWALQYTTGYQHIFKNNTVKIEFSHKFTNWPTLIVWRARGYNTDLVDYYRTLNSYGIGVEIRNFLDDY